MNSAPRSHVWRLLASIVIFEAAWIVCIIAAAHDVMGWGIAAVVVSILWQLAISSRPGLDLALIVAAFGTGLAWDTLLVQSHLVVYASPHPVPALAPLWILALWAQLGAVLREPLRWLHERLWIASAFGALGGAAAYTAAARLGACEFPDATRALVTLALGWGVIIPALVALARYLDRVSADSIPQLPPGAATRR